MNETPTVLVLASYGSVGPEIIKRLVEKTDVEVIATGRKPDKLAQLAANIGSDRVRTRELDAFDRTALTSACAEAGLVINCVGPYAKDGAEIARTVIEARTSYVDFANEQIHYRRLKELGPLAASNGLLLLTAAGAIPGISAIVSLLAAKRLSAVDSLEMYYTQGRMPSPELGLGSLMSAVVDAGFAPMALVDGREVTIRLGGATKTETLPEPFGATDMIEYPTIESLTLPHKLSLDSLRVYWALGEIPPFFFLLVRLLAAHRREWAYRLLSRIMAWGMKHEYERAVAKGLGSDAILKLVARGGGQQWEALVHFEDGAIATSYLPVIAAKKFFSGDLTYTGLVTPIDIFEPEEMLEDLAGLGWALEIEESSSTKETGQ